MASTYEATSGMEYPAASAVETWMDGGGEVLSGEMAISSPGASSSPLESRDKTQNRPLDAWFATPLFWAQPLPHVIL